MNEQNLIPTNKRSKSEVRKNASKGGKGAVQAYNSFVDLLGDRNREKKDLEIKRLKEEVNKLLLEQEKLKRDLNMGEKWYS